MITALSTISEMPSGKVEVARFSRLLKDEILAGTKDPLPIFVHLKYIEKTITDILKDEEIEECILKEFLLHEKEKIVEVNGAKLNMSEVGTKYEYSASGDQIYNDLVKEMESLKEKIKERENFLKALPTEGAVCSVNGNYLTRPPKSSKTKVICKIY